MTTRAAQTVPCPHCGVAVREDQELLACPECGAIHHAVCWQVHGRCAAACHGAVGISNEPMMPPAPPAGTVVAPGMTYVPPTPVVQPLNLGELPPETMVSLEVSLGASVTQGYNAMQRHMSAAIAGFLLLIVLSLLTNIPYVGAVLALVLQPMIYAGLTILSLNIVNDHNPSFSDAFAGFKEFWKWMGAFYLFSLAFLAAALPAIIGLLVFFGLLDQTKSSSDTGAVIVSAVVMSFCILISAVVAAILYARWLFYFFVVAEGGGILESFGRSAELTQGQRLRLLGIDIVLSLLAVAGVLACLAGLVFTVPLASCATAYLYTAVKSQRLSALTR